jgi:TRAP transporter TAXI family solute receptor
MKHFIAVIAAGLVLIVAGPSSAVAQGEGGTQPGDSGTTAGVGGAGREIVIGAGAVSGAYFPAAGAICHVVAAHNPDSRCFVESNENSSANLKRLSSGLLDFAIVQSDWLMHASKGTNIFNAEGPNESLRAVMALHAESLTLVARADAGIAGPADLESKRVSIGPAFTYQRVLMEALLRAWDIDAGDLAPVQEMTGAEQFSALCAGGLDAAAIVTAHPSPVLANAMQRCNLKLVPVTGKELDALLEVRPELSRATIPGGLYRGADDAVPTFGLRAILASTSNVEDGLVRMVTEAVLDSIDEFKGQHPVLAGITAENMPSAGIALPLHDAAKAVYREKGLLSAE